jgi:homeobox-leucine zipper protein
VIIITTTYIITYKLAVTVNKLDMNRVAIEEEWMEVEDEEDTHPRKKLRLTKEQSRLLEERFRTNHTLNPVRILVHTCS